MASPKRLHFTAPSVANMALAVAALLMLGADAQLQADNPTATVPPRPPKQDSSYEELAKGPWQVQLLPGCNGFVFTMYGCPAAVDELKQLVHVMKEKGLGNGFDPGPTARAASQPLFEYLATVGWPVICYPGWSDMQVKDGRSRLTDQDEQTLQILDRAGVFSAIQLGEWGYYFHNLSSTESWWRDVYGTDFEKFRHLIKPPGLKGYDALPTSRRQCYDTVRDYFITRDRAMRGRTMSITGHSHYEAYAAEWGARVVGLELGENIAFTQSKIAFARGAARQWRRPWSLQASPWFAGSCTTSGPLRKEGPYARGLDAGHSLNFYQRMWLHGWFAGAAMVTPENSIGIFFEAARSPWQLTSHGQRARELFAFMQAHDRGLPYTPVAILLDHLAGYNAYQGRPWGILENTPGDLETYELLEQQLFPVSDHIHTQGNPENPESSFLCPTPYGEMFDVLLSNAPVDVLKAYPAILLVGDIEFDAALVDRLVQAATAGSRLLLQPRHAEALHTKLQRLQNAGAVEVLAPAVNPRTGRPAAISPQRLARLAEELLPLAIEGAPVQYQVNRNRQGWVVQLVNNAGIVKKPDQPAVVDPQAVAHVVLLPRFPVATATEWRSGRQFPTDKPLALDIPPGETLFIQLTASRTDDSITLPSSEAPIDASTCRPDQLSRNPLDL